MARSSGLKSSLKILIIILTSLNVVSASESKTTSLPEFKTVLLGEFRESDRVSHLESSGTNGLFFAFQPFSGNGQIIARFRRTKQFTGKAGLLFRQNTNSESLYAGAFLSETGTTFERLREIKQPRVSTVLTNEIVEWLRVVREGDAFSGFHSSDGTNWTHFSADSIEMGNTIYAGIALSGIIKVEVDEISLTSASLVNPVERARFIVPTNIILKANVTSLRGSARKVEFLSGFRKIGEIIQAPYTITWTDAMAGDHSILAKITDVSGAEFFTEPIDCKIVLPPARAKFVGVDDVTKGNWKEKYGAEGFNIICHATNYPAYAEVSSKGHKSEILQYTSDPGALQLTNGRGRIAASSFTYSNMTINVSLMDGRSCRIALYVQDWANNKRVQTIEVIDSSRNIVLDRRRAVDFFSGKYFVWDIRGAVRFRITTATTFVCNAVVNGIFFDATPETSLIPQSEKRRE